MKRNYRSYLRKRKRRKRRGKGKGRRRVSRAWASRKADIPAFGRLKQDDQEFEASLSCMVKAHLRNNKNWGGGLVVEHWASTQEVLGWSPVENIDVSLPFSPTAVSTRWSSYFLLIAQRRTPKAMKSARAGVVKESCSQVALWRKENNESKWAQAKKTETDYPPEMEWLNMLTHLGFCSLAPGLCA